MLKDRRVLIEHDLKIAQDKAAHLYFEIVTTEGDVHSAAYQQLRDIITKLRFDLELITCLIDNGQD